MRVIRLIYSVNRADVRIIQRCQDLCFATEAAEAVAIVDEAVGKNLQRNVAPQLAVPRAVHVTHPARSERSRHFIRTKAGAAGESHQRAADSSAGYHPLLFVERLTG